MSHSNEINKSLNKIFFAVSDPSRRKILEIVCEKDLYASDIKHNFSSSFPTISNHMKILTECSLLHRRRESQKIKYSINLNALEEARVWIEALGKANLIDYENLERFLESFDSEIKPDS